MIIPIISTEFSYSFCTQSPQLFPVFRTYSPARL